MAGAAAGEQTNGSSSAKKRQEPKPSSSNAAAKKRDSKAEATTGTTMNVVLSSLFLIGAGQIFYRMLLESYKIRLYAIEEYGRVIHEFDPYFNYRATEYLWANGWKKFSTWFDYKVWYPLGRPVGTTIYPGMQVTAVMIKKYLLPNWSINDICCFIPAWFGVLATMSVGWLTWNCVSGQPGEFRCLLTDIPVVRDIYAKLLKPTVTGTVAFLKKLTGSDWGLSELSRRQAPSWTTTLACAVSASAIMAIVPAHLLRSVGGGYDNESVAMTAMVTTFACWTMSLKTFDATEQNQLWLNGLWGVMTGIAYFNMVAAWGGYVFVLNLVGVHAGCLVLLGRYSRKLWLAYTLFYVVGTALAIRVPVVGLTPLKSLEQMGPLVAFGGLQLIEFSEYLIRKQQATRNGGRPLTRLQAWKLRLTVFLGAGAVAGVVVAMLMPKGYFGPISSRVRGLFVQHTKTGNPLVDSVAEHQAASPQAYFQYLNNIMFLAPIGFAITAGCYVSDSSSFLLVYGLAAYYFSHRMVRLILLTAPIASALGGIVLGRFAEWSFESVLGGPPLSISEMFSEDVVDGIEESREKEESADGSAESSVKKAKEKAGSKGKKTSRGKAELESAEGTESTARSGDSTIVRGIRMLFSAWLIFFILVPAGTDFWEFSHEMAKHISHPSIIIKGTLQDGTEVMVDDYREAYFWLKKKTPEDARIMAWWDYGYQITGISDRTTIADGNTWNHEHIAFLGRILTSPEKEAHRIARHLADYMLVWAGGGGDDLAKSPHLRRIANSVFRGLCREPTCSDFGFYVRLLKFFRSRSAPYFCVNVAFSISPNFASSPSSARPNSDGGYGAKLAVPPRRERTNRRRNSGQESVQRSVQDKVWQGSHLQDHERLARKQGMGCRSNQPYL